MDPNSILVGNCYRDRFGAVFEVKTIDKGYVTFAEYQKSDGGGSSASKQTVPLTKFVQNLESQVPCPQ